MNHIEMWRRRRKQINWVIMIFCVLAYIAIFASFFFSVEIIIAVAITVMVSTLPIYCLERLRNDIREWIKEDEEYEKQKSLIIPPTPQKDVDVE